MGGHNCGPKLTNANFDKAELEYYIVDRFFGSKKQGLLGGTFPASFHPLYESLSCACS